MKDESLSVQERARKNLSHAYDLMKLPAEQHVLRCAPPASVRTQCRMKSDVSFVLSPHMEQSQIVGTRMLQFCFT